MIFVAFLLPTKQKSVTQPRRAGTLLAHVESSLVSRAEELADAFLRLHIAYRTYVE